MSTSKEAAQPLPPGDEWDAMAAEFQRFVTFCSDPEGTTWEAPPKSANCLEAFPYWQLRKWLLLIPMEKNPRLRAVHDRIDRPGTRWITATTELPIFVEWWAATHGLPPAIDTQNPPAVQQWLEDLAGRVEWLWQGYQSRASKGPVVVLPDHVFRPVASLARDTVVGLTGSHLAPFAPQGALGAFATAKYLRGDLSAFLRAQVSPPPVPAESAFSTTIGQVLAEQERQARTVPAPGQLAPLSNDTTAAAASRNDSATKDAAVMAPTVAKDGSWLRVGTRTFQFTKGNQAQAVLALFDAWQKAGGADGCGMNEESIGDAVGSSAAAFRMAQAFELHPDWRTIIGTPSKGVFALYLHSPPPTAKRRVGGR